MTTQNIKTPIICRAIRYFQKAYTKNLDSQLLTKLFQANLYLVSQYSINYYIKIGLTEALRDKKKRRRRGK